MRLHALLSLKCPVCGELCEMWHYTDSKSYFVGCHRTENCRFVSSGGGTSKDAEKKFRDLHAEMLTNKYINERMHHVPIIAP